MGRLLFMFMPWWFFAILAVTCGSLALPSYDDYTAAQTEQYFAQTEGPPAVVDIANFNGARDIGYLDEVHVNGRILANLGVLRFGGEGPDFDGIVIGDNSGLPLAVLLFESLSSERMINQLISGANANSRVNVQGFLTTVRRTDVERELTRRGYSARNILVIEPYFDNRAGVIDEKVQDALITLLIIAGMTALFTLTAVWRFHRWRKRRAGKKLRRSTAKRVQATPAAAPAATANQTLTGKSNPWGGVQKPRLQTAKTQPPSNPPPQRAPDPEPDLPAAQTSFESVFPNGGSPFRIKTADEIVRQYFGSLTTITRSNPDS